MNWQQRLGLWRSILIYYLKPGQLRRMRSFYRSFIRPGELCFDLGAHLGNRCAVWLELGARVVAVEPQPLCVEYLEKRFGHLDGFTLVPAAVGAAPGRATLHLSSPTPTVSTLADEEWRESLARHSRWPTSWEETLEVEVLTLDELIRRFGRPAFCKIDVEGWEYEVLMGLHQPLPALSFEFLAFRLDLARRCLERLCHLGDYVFNWSKRETMKLAEARWLEAEPFERALRKWEGAAFSGDIYARLQTPTP
ncbi:MAG: FkbM family methyltransferase [Bacteroidetes bacterium]|nr:MAG: FkbM family methyltransferase [Bacteroidota bacterium]